MDKPQLIHFGEKIKLDEKDKAILTLLHHNARMPISQISRKTGIQRDSVMYRIKRMERLHVIRSHTSILNPSVLGYPIYSYVSFVLHNIDEETEKSFVQFLVSNTQITYVAKVSGKWDYEIVIAAKNLEDFENTLKRIRYKYSSIIRNYDSSAIIQEYKFDYLVDLIP